MADFFEIDFLQVHTSKSGDAIGIRYEQAGLTYIHIVDGGYLATGEKLVQHINEHYGSPSYIDHVVVTHPDQDHAEGLQTILEEFEVGALWMLLPWNYVDVLIDRFDRYTNLDNLKKKLRDAYPYLDKLEKIANSKGIPIYEPFQGALIGAFTVLTPSRRRYLDLVVTSSKTPAATEGILAAFDSILVEAKRLAKAFIRAAWGDEAFPDGDTSNENEMSVVQFGRLCGKSIVLTADTGRDGLAEAADYAPYVGLSLPGGVDRFQIPHHGGRHNVSTEILDRWFGERLSQCPAPGSETFVAVVSAAEDDDLHPRKVVIRAFAHRGAKILSTDDGRGTKQTGHNAPTRAGWTAATPVEYPEEMED